MKRFHCSECDTIFQMFELNTSDPDVELCRRCVAYIDWQDAKFDQDYKAMYGLESVIDEIDLDRAKRKISDIQMEQLKNDLFL